jgi:hypothetical protein
MTAKDELFEIKLAVNRDRQTMRVSMRTATGGKSELASKEIVRETAVRTFDDAVALIRAGVSPASRVPPR